MAWRKKSNGTWDVATAPFIDAQGRKWSRIEHIDNKAAAGYYPDRFEEPTVGYDAILYDNGTLTRGVVEFGIIAEVPSPLDSITFLGVLDGLPNFKASWEAAHPAVRRQLNSPTFTWAMVTEIGAGLIDAGEPVETLAQLQAAWLVGSKPAPETPPGNPWVVGGRYARGSICTHGGRSYTCIQSHVADSARWAPPNVPKLWQDTGPA